jgi:hypothetical protein
MCRNRFLLTYIIGIGLLVILSLPGWSATRQDPAEPTDEEILRTYYSDGKLTKDKQNRHIIHGGKYAENNGKAPKIIQRIERLRGRLYQKDREELIVLLDVTNENVGDCCVGEAVLIVFDLRGAKAKPLWIHSLRHIRLANADVSLVEANSDGTQQILLKYETWGSCQIQQTAILYVPRPARDWSPPPAWREDLFWMEKDTRNQPFVKIWVGTLKWDEGPYAFDDYCEQPTGASFSRATFTSKIRFSDASQGWKDLIEERTITMLLGKPLDSSLKVEAIYRRSGRVYSILQQQR